MVRDLIQFLGNFLFRFHGRVNRAKMWVFTTWILLVPLAMDEISVWNARAHSGIGDVVDIVLAIVALAVLYCFAAVAAKRLHDRNRSAWFLAIFFLPSLVASLLHEGAPARSLFSVIAAVASAWFFVEGYLLPGTAGENRFGPDPLPPIKELPPEQV